MKPFVSLVAIAWMGALSVPAQSAGLPLVVSATVDYAHGTVIISGKNFGSGATVTLDSMQFPTQSSASTQVIANFPAGKGPSSFVPGTYFLTLLFKNQLPAVFAVDVGANGPSGASGAQGPAGVAGPVGPQGLPGMLGIPGAQGPAGAQGPPGQGVDASFLQRIALLQSELDALRQTVATTPGGNVQITAPTSLQLLTGAAKSETVGASSQETVGGSRTTDIGGSDTLTVGVDRSISVGGNQSFNIGAGETSSVVGSQSLSVGADQKTTVVGNLVVSAGNSVQISGPKGASVSLNQDGSISITAGTGAGIQMLADKDILIKASGDIVLKGSHIQNN